MGLLVCISSPELLLIFTQVLAMLLLLRIQADIMSNSVYSHRKGN
jgi:hypothetical protein